MPDLDDLAGTIRERLAGPLPHLPERLDGLSERWWGLRPRIRVGLTVFACVVLASLPLLRTARSAWGPPVPVLVATVDLEAGALLDTAAVVPAQRPASLVPADALQEPTGILTMPVLAGTVLTERHRAATLPSLLRSGEVAVPVPTDLQPHVAAGAVVDLLSAAFDGQGRTIAVGGRVLQVDAAWIWVAVPEQAAADAAAAAVDQRLILAVRGAGSGSGGG
jgi:Flp pilus assembly protein CpaB